jgi:cell wall-associated NlpC family hydrolase
MRTKRKKTKNKIFVKSFALVFLIVLSFCVVSSAFADALVPCGLEGAADCTLCHLVLGFKNIYDYFFTVLLAATTLVAVVAGVMYMVSSGDKGMIDKAKSALTYALTAMILALTAWLIINATLTALGYTKVDNRYTFTCDTTQTKGATGGSSATTAATATTATKATGSGGKITGTGMVTSGEKTLAQVAADLKEKTVYVDKLKSSKVGWVDGVFYGDCSSWAQEFYKEAYGIDPGGTTTQMKENANGSTDRSTLTAGDLLIVNGSHGNGTHAVIYLGDDSVVGNSTQGVNVKYGKLSGYTNIAAVVKAPS